MKDKDEKSKQLVKSIKMFESVLKSSPDASQRARVKKDINKLRESLEELYPDANLKELEDAIYTDIIASQLKEDDNLTEFELLKDVKIEKVSHYKDDIEINEAISICRYFEERIWSVITDQHTKLDFTNSGERDTLNRLLDQCNRSFEVFSQTIEDIEKTKSPEYSGQLQLMRTKQGRVFLFEFSEFLKRAKEFVSNLVSDSEFGRTMILNPDDKIVYADYEKYRVFENWKVSDSIKHIKKFLDEVLKVIKIPDVDKFK